MAASMDALDQKILFELDCNSRRSLSDIARKVHLGRDLVGYRVERLKQLGILKRTTAMINPYKLGLTVYKTYLKLQADKARWNEFVAYLDSHQLTSWLAECYGKWDVIWCVLARSPKKVYDLQDKLFSEFRDIILSYNVSTLVNYWWFPKKYLLRGSLDDVTGWGFHIPEFTFGDTPLEHQLDRIEYGIIQLLSADAQLSDTELAKALNSTPAVIKYRTQKLEELGVIAGYRVDVDRSLLGRSIFKVQVHPREYNAKMEMEFHNFCRTHPLICSYHQQLGDCKLEFEVEAKDYTEFNAVIDDVRDRFSNYIRNLEHITVRKDYFHRTPCNIFVDKNTRSECEEIDTSSISTQLFQEKINLPSGISIVK